ncbi:MAG: methyltransferase [Pseudomonadales bacterium]|nr:methyltransferase [Pseudomonadales bacterium]
MNDKSVRANIRYVAPTAEKPIYYASEGGAEAELSIEHAEFSDREITILDARTQLEDASLDQHGFSLVSHATKIEDFHKLNGELDAYEKEISALVLAATSANSVHIFDHTRRSDSADVRGQHQIRETASIIHNDYTDYSAKKRLRDLLPGEAEIRLQKRFAIVNVWRTIAGPVFRNPLACCDATTLDAEDLIASERRAKDRIGELELVRYSSRHRWFYYPEMQRDEALLIKTFDSLAEGVARRSVHTAFENPLAPKDAPPRESMESRMLVFY